MALEQLQGDLVRREAIAEKLQENLSKSSELSRTVDELQRLLVMKDHQAAAMMDEHSTTVHGLQNQTIKLENQKIELENQKINLENQVKSLNFELYEARNLVACM